MRATSSACVAPSRSAASISSAVATCRALAAALVFVFRFLAFFAGFFFARCSPCSWRRASARCRSASTAAKGARHLRASLYDRLGPLPPVARGHGSKSAPHAVATFASSIKIFGQRSTPCRGAAAAATKRRRNR